MRKKEIKEMSVTQIIRNIFFYGITMSDDRGTKQEDKELLWHCLELEHRGIVPDGNILYDEMCK